MVLGGPGFEISSDRALRIPRTSPRRRLRLPGSSCIWLSPPRIDAFALHPMGHSTFSRRCLEASVSNSTALISSLVVAARALSWGLFQSSSRSPIWTWIGTPAPDFSYSSWPVVPQPISRCPGSSPCRRCGRRAPATACRFYPNA